MAESRVDRLEERLDRLEKKVDGGFARLDQRFDEVFAAMGEGFAEHRQLLIDYIDGRVEQLGLDLGGRIDEVRSDMKQDLAREVGAARIETRNGFDAVHAALNAQAVGMGTRFDRLEAKLDAFIDAQAAVNRTLLERLDR